MSTDYNKWDKFDCSDSEGYSSENDDSTDPNEPQVTRLDTPSSITFGSNFPSISMKPTPTPPSKKPLLKPSKRAIEFIHQSVTPRNQTQTPPITNGSTFLDSKTNTQIYWSQTTAEVDVYITVVQPHIRASDISITVSGAVKFIDRFSAVGLTSSLITLSVSLKEEGTTLLSGNLSHSIYLGDEDDSPELEKIQPDWEMIEFGGVRFVKVTLNKAVPMAGVVVWWSRVMSYHDEIDLSLVNGRGGKGGEEKGEKMMEVWEEAHKMFKAKVAGRTVTTVDTEEGGEEEDEEEGEGKKEGE